MIFTAFSDDLSVQVCAGRESTATSESEKIPNEKIYEPSRFRIPPPAQFRDRASLTVCAVTAVPGALLTCPWYIAWQSPTLASTSAPSQYSPEITHAPEICQPKAQATKQARVSETSTARTRRLLSQRDHGTMPREAIIAGLRIESVSSTPTTVKMEFFTN